MNKEEYISKGPSIYREIRRHQWYMTQYRLTELARIHLGWYISKQFKLKPLTELMELMQRSQEYGTKNQLLLEESGYSAGELFGILPDAG